MNRFNRLLLPLLAGFTHAVLVPAIHAQEAAEGEGEADQRVQYQLVRPDEKTPETVKPEEHNPFESESEAQDRMTPGDTEENRVRDVLLRLKVAGTKRMSDGRMRVLLGNIILETGKPVPPVLPDQQVELKVKNITPEAIELAWQEKRATGLPPKLMIIPISTLPRVRYQMLGQVGEDGTEAKGGVNASMNMPLRSHPPRQQTAPLTSAPPMTTPMGEPQPLPAELVLDDPPSSPKAQPTDSTPAPAMVATPAATPATATAASPHPVTQAEKKFDLADQTVPLAPVPPPLEPPPARTPAPPASPAVESMVRMLFGNPTPKSTPEPK